MCSRRCAGDVRALEPNANDEDANDDEPTIAPPETWLLRHGWKRGGGAISTGTIPGLPPGAPPLGSIVELVATQFTKGVIVWQTLYGCVIIGPTAEPQASSPGVASQ